MRIIEDHIRLSYSAETDLANEQVRRAVIFVDGYEVIDTPGGNIR